MQFFVWCVKFETEIGKSEVIVIELRNNSLLASFPEVHPEARCKVTFQRTLRVPDDNQEYPLPAGLGSFPLLSVDDHPVPDHWKQHGGVFFPMYQSEAMWICFDALRDSYPFAVKIAAGKINAVTGKPWSNDLCSDPQDYVVLPTQPWLDGFHASKDAVRQFVAMPLGQGFSAEEQITGAGKWGGLQLIFYPMKIKEYRKRFQSDRCANRFPAIPAAAACRSIEEMDLAPGGRIKQEIAADEFGIDVWDTAHSSRCFVHLLNSDSYREVTGQTPPTRPITAQMYASAGIPWFDYYLDGPALLGSSVLAGLDGVGAAMLKKGTKMADNASIDVSSTIKLSKKPGEVRDGDF